MIKSSFSKITLSRFTINARKRNTCAHVINPKNENAPLILLSGA
jgi:hypothetical protein